MSDQTYRDAYKKHGTLKAAAEAMGLTFASFRHRLDRERENEGKRRGVPKKDVSEKDVSEEFSKETRDDGRTLYVCSQSRRIKTFTDAMEYGEIDEKIWEIGDGSKVGSYEVTLKIANDDGVDVPTTVMMWRVSLRLVRKAAVELAVESIFEKIAERSKKLPAVKYPKRKRRVLAELSFYDVHFGKLCYGAQVNDRDYDLDIAARVFVDAVDDLLESLSHREIEKIVIPIGHDFFQANNWVSTTAKGTVVEHVDDRFCKVFDCGELAVRETLLKCRERAEVEVVWVPGNHDPETSWYLVRTLEAEMRSVSGVTFDRGPQFRKYQLYGKTLIGRTHGNEEKQQDLPLIMATEEAELWGQSTYRQVLTGHFHKAKERSFNVGDTHNGVRVQILPSLSGTDAWHYRKGYVKNLRAAECLLFDYDNGPAGQFPAFIREAE